mgnify:CR=1 FL=1
MNEHEEPVVRLHAANGVEYEPATPPDPAEGELEHVEVHLRKHGLSIAELLRTVAKNFHGVTVPPYNPSEE